MVRSQGVSGLRALPQVKAGSITRHFCIKGALSRSSKDLSLSGWSSR